MANIAPRQHYNIAVPCFFEIFMGLELSSLEDVDPKTDVIHGRILAMEFQVEMPELDIIKIGVGDRSHNTYMFAGRIKDTDANTKLTIPSSENNDWIRQHLYNFSDSRTDMRRWWIRAYIRDEQNKKRIRGWGMRNGIMKRVGTAGDAKYDGSDPGKEEMEFLFERYYDIQCAVKDLMSDTVPDITDLPTNYVTHRDFTRTKTYGQYGYYTTQPA